MVVDELARRHGASWKGKFSGQLAELRLDGHRVALLKPETFMNESGRSVGAAARFFKLEPDALLVVHDEVDLEPGRLQARSGGGLAGHNGLRSIAASQDPGLPASARRRRPAGPRRSAPARRLRALGLHAGRRRRRHSSRGLPTRSRRSTPKGSTSAGSVQLSRDERGATMTTPNRRVRPFVMDQPDPPPVRRGAPRDRTPAAPCRGVPGARPRLRAGAAAAARALHEELDRPLVLLRARG